MGTGKVVPGLTGNKKNSVLFIALGLGFLIVSFLLLQRGTGQVFFYVSTILAVIFFALGLFYMVRLVQKKS